MGQKIRKKISQDAPQSGRGLAFFNDIDPNFDEAGFLDGAARAYEMILTAFAKGDLTDVQGFLGDEVAAGFEAAIAARQAAAKNWKRVFCASTDRRLMMRKSMAIKCASMCACAPRLFPPVMRR